MATVAKVWQGVCEVVDRRELAADYFALTCRAAAIAERVTPGQFVNVLVESTGLCLRRPISVHRVDEDRVTLIVGVQGQGTTLLREARVGDALDLLGPLGGRGLSLEPGVRRVALVGGGVGIPPLHFLATRAPAGVELTAFVGARTAERLLCLDDFAAAGCAVVPATDDGSAGFRGTAVAALAAGLAEAPFDQLLTCGPTPMMAAAARLALARGIPCQVCLEARMACAVGACLSCVIETTAEGWRRYQRVCTEGPVFDAAEVVWDTLSPLCA